MRRFVFIVLALLASFGCRGPADPTSEANGIVAFVDVNVVPMDREVILPHQTVIVRSGRIARIGSIDATAVPTGSQRIDSQGAYLMPGLVDMHVHPGDVHELILFVANGVTTIRNMHGFPDKHLLWRKQVENGEIVGPTLYTSGPLLEGTPAIPGSEVVETPHDARRVVEAQKREGYDFIKVLSSVRSKVYGAIAAAGAAHNIRVVGHVPFSVDLDEALSSGISSIEHLTGYEFALQSEGSPAVDRSEAGALRRAWIHFDESKLREVVEKTKQAGAWNCPTLEAFRAYLPENMELLRERRELLKYVSPSMWEWWEADLNNPAYEGAAAMDRLSMDARRQVVRALAAGGARILLGTDAGSTGVIPGFSAHREAQNLADAGLTPYEAIRAGTVDASEFLGSEDEFGTVTVGRRADLILVGGNPFEKIENTSNIMGVMLGGKWLPRAKLDEMLDGVVTSYRRQVAEEELQ